MRFSFYLVQLLDGFKTTNDNVNGLMIKYISDARFKNLEEIVEKTVKLTTTFQSKLTIDFGAN